MKKYAVIDHAVLSEFTEKVQLYDLRCSCLFYEPVDEKLYVVSPFLVKINDEMEAWLKGQESLWGLFIETEVDFNELRQHLRQQLYVCIPTESAPVFFRFYDPYTFWDFLDVINDNVLLQFIGPIHSVSCHLEGERKERSFETLKKKGLPKAFVFPSYLALTAQEFNHMTQIQHHRLSQQLSSFLYSLINFEFLKSIYSVDKIHREMLLHEKEIKGSEITHESDIEILEGKVGEDVAYYYYFPIMDMWIKLRGETEREAITEAEDIALREIEKSPISEFEFHSLTNYQFIKPKLSVMDEEDLDLTDEEGSTIWFPRNEIEIKVALSELSGELIAYLDQYGINRKELREEIGKALISYHIYRFEDIPSASLEALIEKRSIKRKIEAFIETLKLSVYALS